MEFSVFIWKSWTSMSAEIYELIAAEDAQEAAFAAMQKHQLSYAGYVWVVPEVAGADPAGFEHLDCPGISGLLGVESEVG